MKFVQVRNVLAKDHVGEGTAWSSLHLNICESKLLRNGLIQQKDSSQRWRRGLLFSAQMRAADPPDNAEVRSAAWALSMNDPDFPGFPLSGIRCIS